MNRSEKFKTVPIRTWKICRHSRPLSGKKQQWGHLGDLECDLEGVYPVFTPAFDRTNSILPDCVNQFENLVDCDKSCRSNDLTIYPVFSYLCYPPGVDVMKQGDASVPDFVVASKGTASNPNMQPGSTWKSLTAEPRWQLAQRIVASRSFAKSALLSRFLLYVCEREITGKIGEISEQQIGVHVFGRRSGYNPGEDNIVRNYARQLRHRLDQYFLEEGREEELRLSIPDRKSTRLNSSHVLRSRMPSSA